MQRRCRALAIAALLASLVQLSPAGMPPGLAVPGVAAQPAATPGPDVPEPPRSDDAPTCPIARTGIIAGVVGVCVGTGGIGCLPAIAAGAAAWVANDRWWCTRREAPATSQSDASAS